jgi:hypothetical protein
LGSFETLKINPTLASKPITPFDPGEFVGPVAPGSPKPSPTTATDLTLTPSFLTQVQAEEDVRQAFDRVLGRQPFAGPGSGLEYWTNELVKGNVTLADLDQAIAFGAQGGDRLAANKFLGTDYFKVADSNNRNKPDLTVLKTDTSRRRCKASLSTCFRTRPRISTKLLDQ